MRLLAIPLLLLLPACSLDTSEVSDFITHQTHSAEELLCGWVLTDVLWRDDVPGCQLWWATEHDIVLQPHGAPVCSAGNASNVLVVPYGTHVDVYVPETDGDAFGDPLPHTAFVQTEPYDGGC